MYLVGGCWNYPSTLAVVGWSPYFSLFHWNNMTLLLFDQNLLQIFYKYDEECVGGYSCPFICFVTNYFCHTLHYLCCTFTCVTQVQKGKFWVSWRQFLGRAAINVKSKYSGAWVYMQTSIHEKVCRFSTYLLSYVWNKSNKCN